MNDSVKSISLDDIGEIPNLLGMAGPGENTRARAVQYTPQYGNLANNPLPSSGAAPEEGTVRRDDKFNLTSMLTRFTDLIGPMAGPSTTKRNQAIMIGAAVLVAVVGMFYFFGDGLMGGGDTASETSVAESAAAPPPAEPAAGKHKPKVEIVANAPVLAKPQVQAVTAIRGNPYWKLPNPVAALADASVAMTAQQIEKARGGLAHPFSYQRYKAVEDLRKAKLEGTVTILYEALAQPKLWTRMESILAIAEQGVTIDSDSMTAAIGDARSDLVRNYFKRFKAKYTDATAHVLRASLRVVDAKARLIVLESLAAHRSDTNDMYLIAALSDSDASTKSFASEILKAQPALAATQENFAKVMSDAPVMIPVQIGKFKKPGSQDIKVEKIPANLNVEEVYFINDEEAPAEAPKEVKKEDDGFNDLDHKDHVEPAKTVK
ncbi:MAG: hypothetical protein H7249_13300 [Chitinophagaceae bacterium]|nr:hypothetical protein [Oligoflexus sp.]